VPEAIDDASGNGLATITTIAATKTSIRVTDVDVTRRVIDRCVERSHSPAATNCWSLRSAGHSTISAASVANAHNPNPINTQPSDNE
jgi:hypothetical protein